MPTQDDGSTNFKMMQTKELHLHRVMANNNFECDKMGNGWTESTTSSWKHQFSKKTPAKSK